MANKVTLYCEGCGQEVAHWDNRVGKRNPKAPDYKCTVCGKGIWEPKEPTKPQPKPQPKHQLEPSTDYTPRSMCYSYVKDCIVELIKLGKIADLDEAVKLIADKGDTLHTWANE